MPVVWVEGAGQQLDESGVCEAVGVCSPLALEVARFEALRGSGDVVLLGEVVVAGAEQYRLGTLSTEEGGVWSRAYHQEAETPEHVTIEHAGP